MPDTPTTPRPVASSATAMTSEQFLEHWQGHRRLTRRAIEAFPEERLFTHSIGGMRSFGAMMGEVVTMVAPTLRGVLDDVWDAESAMTPEKDRPADRDELLRAWDEATREIDEAWPGIPPERFPEVVDVFGWTRMPVIAALAYLVDNEIHHRGQGYVYLRSLGIEPPAFYER